MQEFSENERALTLSFFFMKKKTKKFQKNFQKKLDKPPKKWYNIIVVRERGKPFQTKKIKKPKGGKEVKVMEKKDLIARMELIIEKSAVYGCHFSAKVNDWENYGKNRTYFSIVETRDNSKRIREKTYGYFDNQTGEYFPDKLGDLRNNYTVHGYGF